MDPDTVLAEMLSLATDILSKPDQNEDAIQLAEYLYSIHNWIRRGGFLPEEWKASS